ncbi:hypothetical protein Tco_0998145 [Tanacetum coccineum]
MVWSGYAVLMSGKTDSITKLNNIPGCLSGSIFVYSEVFKLDFSSASFLLQLMHADVPACKPLFYLHITNEFRGCDQEFYEGGKSFQKRRSKKGESEEWGQVASGVEFNSDERMFEVGNGVVGGKRGTAVEREDSSEWSGEDDGETVSELSQSEREVERRGTWSLGTRNGVESGEGRISLERYRPELRRIEVEMVGKREGRESRRRKERREERSRRRGSGRAEGRSGERKEPKVEEEERLEHVRKEGPSDARRVEQRGQYRGERGEGIRRGGKWGARGG